MPRALFEKTGNAVYISHLDLMRLLQRGFKRAGLPLTHSQGFNPRPSVSIALPLSLGVESRCELLDFQLEGTPVPNREIRDRLNEALPEGVRILEVYDNGRKLKELTLLESLVILEYDAGVPEDAAEKIRRLFSGGEVMAEKKGKKGPVQQNLIPMIRRLEIEACRDDTLVLSVLANCQDPALNPGQISSAISLYLPELRPDFVRYLRREIYDTNVDQFR